jgi:anti-sigma factor RsiW
VTTAACQVCRELIGGYVLDALEPDERELVRCHIETCDRCAQEHAELAALPALLELADSADAVPLRPPPRLEEAVLDGFARERRGASQPAGDTPVPQRAAAARRRRWRLPAAAALACGVAAIVAAIALSGGEATVGDGGGAVGRIAGVATHPRPLVYRVGLTGEGPLPDAVAEARLYPGETGTGVHLRASGLKSGKYHYELWCVRDDGWKVSGGTFRADAAGNADVRLTTSAKPTQYDALAIEARPAGRGAAARGKRVLSGRLRT